jgi:hypothetical protein
MADHSQAPIVETIDLQGALSELGVLQPPAADLVGALTGSRAQARSRDGVEPRIAVCPSQRAAMVYALHPSERDAMRASVLARAAAIEGVDLLAWLARDAHDRPAEGVVSSPARGELRFAPGGDLRDARGVRWHVDGELSVLGAAVHGAENALLTPAYPDALARLWATLTCPTAGEVLLSAAPGCEFIDWGGGAHVGGGSHGSLHASDSLAPLVLCGVDLPRDPPGQWAIRDVAALVRKHFDPSAP